jgi:hypothetical protein
MAKQQVFGVGLLPDGRALRVVKMDARRMLEVSRRVGASFGTKQPTTAEAYAESQKQTIAMCVRGVTSAPVELKQITRMPSDDDVQSAIRGGNPPPGPRLEVDLDATLKPYTIREAPEFGRWVAVGEQELTNDADDNPMSMFALLEEPAAWRAALDLIDAAGGSFLNPFAAKVLKTSVG